MITTSAHHHLTGSRGRGRGPLFLLIFCVNLLLFQSAVSTEVESVTTTTITNTSQQQQQQQLPSPPPLPLPLQRQQRQLSLQSGLKLVETTIRIVDIINETESDLNSTANSHPANSSSSKAVKYATIERTEGRLPVGASRLFNLPAFNPLRDVTVRRGRQIVSPAKARQIAQLISELDTSEITSFSSPFFRSRHHRSTTPGNEEEGDGGGGDKKKKVEKQEGSVRVILANGQAIQVSSTSTFGYETTSEPDKEEPLLKLPERRIIKVISVPEVKANESIPEVTLDDRDEYRLVPVTLNYKLVNNNNNGNENTSATTVISKEKEQTEKDKDKDDDDDDDNDAPVNNKYRGLKLNPVKSSGPKQSSSPTTTAAPVETSTTKKTDDNDDDDDDDNDKASADKISKYKGLKLKPVKSSGPKQSTTTESPETTTGRTGVNDDNDDDDDDDDSNASAEKISKYKGLKLNPVKSSGPKQTPTSTESTAEAAREDELSFITTETPITSMREEAMTTITTTTENMLTVEPTIATVPIEYREPFTTPTTAAPLEANEPAIADLESSSEVSKTAEPSNTLENEGDPSALLMEEEEESETPSTTAPLETTVITQTPLLESEMTTTPKTIETSTTTSLSSLPEPVTLQTAKQTETTISPPSKATSVVRTNYTQSRSIESTFYNPQITTTTTPSPTKDTVQIRYRSTTLRPEDKNLFELLYTIFLLNRFEAQAKAANGKDGRRRPVKKIRIKIMEFSEENGENEKVSSQTEKDEQQTMITQQEIFDDFNPTTPAPTNESTFYTERIELGSPFSSSKTKDENTDNYPPPRPVEVKLRITGIINENRTKDGNTVRRTSVRIKPMEMSLRLNYSMRSNGLLNGNIELATLLARPLDARLRVGETIGGDHNGGGGGGGDGSYPLQKLDSRTARSDYPEDGGGGDGGDKEAEESNELLTMESSEGDDKKDDENEDGDETVPKKNKYAHLKLNKVKSSGPRQKTSENSTTTTETPLSPPSNVKFYKVKKTAEVEHHVEDEEEEEETKEPKYESTPMIPTTTAKSTSAEKEVMTSTTEIMLTVEPTIATVPIEYREPFTTTTTTTISPSSSTPKANITAELLEILDNLKEKPQQETPSSSSSTTTTLTTTTTTTTPSSISPSTKSTTTTTTISLPEPIFREETEKAENGKNKTLTTTTTTTTTKSSPEPVFTSSSTTTTTTTPKPKLSLGNILPINSNNSTNNRKSAESGRSLDSSSGGSGGNSQRPSELQLNILLALALLVLFCVLGAAVFCFVKSVSTKGGKRNKGIEEENDDNDDSNNGSDGSDGEPAQPINVGRYSKVVNSTSFPYQLQQQTSTSSSSIPSRHVKWLDIEKDDSVDGGGDFERF